ncbi:N-acetylmuramoyl-L-alanine amidase [Candidatus Sumerlaeota bacterium]|nr:N-acetylmuramoyl-L-alanine amidase [Candidatus Sumerlaeota bacterium]
MRAVFPLVLALVAALPAQVHPPNLLYTAPPGEPLAGLRICVDPGHGGQIWGATRGYTGGTRSSVSSQTESDANLRVGLFLWDLLTQAGAEVVMTRTFETRLSEDCFAAPGSDEYVANRREELNIRVRVAETNDCDLFVAIHHNAGGGPGANHSTAYYFDPALYEPDPDETFAEHSPESVTTSRELAQAIVDALGERLGIETRDARHGNYHVVRETSLPSVLVECAFMTHAEQAEWMEDLAYSRLAAIGIFEGILDQFGQTTMEGPSVEGTESTEEVTP